MDDVTRRGRDLLSGRRRLRRRIGKRPISGDAVAVAAEVVSLDVEVMSYEGEPISDTMSDRAGMRDGSVGGA